MADASKPLRFTGRAALEAEAAAAALPADADVIALQACATPQQQAAVLEASASANEVVAAWLTSDGTALGHCALLFSWVAAAASSARWHDFWLPLLAAGTRKLPRAAAVQLFQKVFLSALSALQFDTARLLLPALAAQLDAPHGGIGFGSQCARCRIMGAMPPTRAMLLAVKQAPLRESSAPAAVAHRALASSGGDAYAVSCRAVHPAAIRFLAHEIYAPPAQPNAAADADAPGTASAGSSAGACAAAGSAAAASAPGGFRFAFPPPCGHASPLEDPVHAAAAMGDAELLQWLADAGYALSSELPGWRAWPCPRSEPLARDRTSRTEQWYQRCSHDTALNIAIREGGSVAAVLALIAAGADPGAVSCCVHAASNGEGVADVVLRRLPEPVAAAAASEAAAAGEAQAGEAAAAPVVGGAGAPAPAPPVAVAAAAVAAGAGAAAAAAPVGAAVPPPPPPAAPAEPADVQAALVPCSPVLSAVLWGRDEMLEHLLTLAEPDSVAQLALERGIDLQAIIPGPLLPHAPAEVAAVLVDQPASANLANLQRKVAPLVLASAAGRDTDDCCWAVGKASSVPRSRPHEMALAAAAAARAAALHSLRTAGRQLMREAFGNTAVMLRQPLFISAGAVLESLAASLRLPREWASETLVREASLHGGSADESAAAGSGSAAAEIAAGAAAAAAGAASAGGLGSSDSSSAGSAATNIDVMAVLERVCPWTALHAASPRTVGLQATLQAIDSNRPYMLELLMCSDALPAHRLPTVVRAFVAARAAATGVPLRRGDALVSEAVLRLRPDMKLLAVAAEARLPAAVHAMRLLNDSAVDLPMAPAEGAAAVEDSADAASSLAAGCGAASDSSTAVAASTESADAARAAAAVELGIAAASQQFCAWYFSKRRGEPVDEDPDQDPLADGLAVAIFRGANPLAFDEAPPDSYVRQEANLRVRVDAVVQAAARALACRAWRRRRHALLCKAPL